MKLFSGAIGGLAILSLSAAGAAAKDIVQTAKDAGKFTMLLQAVEKAGLDGKMQTSGPFTVFAPTDDAFKALPPEVLARLMDPANKAELANVLSYHVLAGRLATTDLKEPKSAAQALNGQAIVLEKKGAETKANDATIIEANVAADNGTIQIVDKVLLPPKPVQPTFTASK